MNEVIFYGVDFSKAKFYAVKEIPVKLKTGVSRISALFVAELKKYDIQKFMGKTVSGYNFDQVQKNNAGIDETTIVTTVSNHYLSETDIKQIISELPETDKPGLIFIGEMMNKAANQGIFHVVLFAGKTKDILLSRHISGKAAGFGVRNFWAGAVYHILKNWRY